MTSPIRTFTTACVAAFILTSCAGDSERYPSLGVRDAERASGEFTPAQTSEIPATITIEAERLISALEIAAAAHAQFMAERNEAFDFVRSAKGAGADSNIRSSALVALASLSSLRGQTAVALGQMDALEVEAATQFASLDAIRTAQAQIAALLAQQDNTLDSLSRELDQ